MLLRPPVLERGRVLVQRRGEGAAGSHASGDGHGGAEGCVEAVRHQAQHNVRLMIHPAPTPREGHTYVSSDVHPP